MTDSVRNAAPAPTDAVSTSWPDSLAPHAGDAPAPQAAPPSGAAQPGGDPASSSEDGAPAEYAAFTLPDGVNVDESTLDEARGLFAAAKLPQAAAQQFVDFYAGKMKAVAEAPHKVWAEMQEQWVRDVNRDPEIGGYRLQDAVKAAGRAIETFGSPALREVLSFTGAGNHPEVVRFFARVGKLVSEDGYVPGTALRARKSAAEIMFPTMREQE